MEKIQVSIEEVEMLLGRKDMQIFVLEKQVNELLKTIERLQPIPSDPRGSNEA